MSIAEQSAPTEAVSWIRTLAAPLLLIAVCPALVMLVWFTNAHLGGSTDTLFSLFSQKGIFATIYSIWAPVFFGTAKAWKILAAFAGFELLLMKVLPGRKFHGPVTPKGNIPAYKANGVSAFLSTLFLFYFATHSLKLFPPL